MRHLWLLVAVALVVPALAVAQGTDRALDMQNFRPAAGPVDYLGGVRGSEIEPHEMVGFSLFLNYTHRPFVLTLTSDDGTGNPVTTTEDAINYQVNADFLWSIGLFNFVQLGLALPVVLSQDGEGAQPALPDAGLLAGTAVRDLRVDIQARFLGQGTNGTPGQGLGLGLALVLTLPTGDSDNFAGEQNVVFDPILLLDYDAGIFSAAANFGARIRESATFMDYELSHQLQWGVGVALRLVDERVSILGEYVGLLNLSDAQAVETDEWVAPGTDDLSQEIRFGVGYTFDANRDMTIQAAGGVGIGSMPGTPEGRAMLNFIYAPLNYDADEDNIYDRDDQCLDGELNQEDVDGFEDDDGCMDPDNDEDLVSDFDDMCAEEAEDFDDFEDDDGCPDPDNDGDGVEDGSDECPMEAEDIDEFEDENGCPDADNDGDTVPDASDTCADSKEDVDQFQDEDGCLDADNDNDTLPDASDMCVNEPETVNAFQDEDGCPDEVPPPPEPPRRGRGR